MPGSAVTDLAGRVLAGRYLLHAAVGTGASGRVYVAEDTRLRRRVAVKVLHAALAEDAAFLRRFRAEAQLAASLHHPHIVTVHDWGDDDVPFMVLELLEGGSLRVDARPGHLPHGLPGGARRARRRVGTRVRARTRRAAPRHQAREPAVRRARDRAGRRLRPCARARRGELDRARGCGVRNRALRVAGTGEGRATRRAIRSVLARARAGRERDWSPAVRGRHDVGPAHRAHVAAAGRDRGARTARARHRPHRRDRSQRPVSRRGHGAPGHLRRRRRAPAPGAVAPRGHGRPRRPAPHPRGARPFRIALRPGRDRGRPLRRGCVRRRVAADPPHARRAPPRPVDRVDRADPHRRARGRRRSRR